MRQWTTPLKKHRAWYASLLSLAVAFLLPQSSFGFADSLPEQQSAPEQHSQIELGSDAFNPARVFDQSDFFSSWESAQAAALNVLEYLRANTVQKTLEDLEDALPKYNRREHFYGWINADPTTNCFDTRTEVLLRDADKAVQVVFKDAKKCNVARGLWHDPYTGEDFKTSTSIQIDHVVPLKHAYLTGAAAWKTSRRCAYGNFLSNSFHLLAVSGHENMSKGGKGPDGYMPPNEAYACEYVAEWMKIKAIWKLKATPDELAAIESVVQRYRCSASRFQIASSTLQSERDATNVSPKRCAALDSQTVNSEATDGTTESVPGSATSLDTTSNQLSLPFHP